MFGEPLRDISTCRPAPPTSPGEQPFAVHLDATANSLPPIIETAVAVYPAKKSFPGHESDPVIGYPPA
jgi:hypothetical protein